MSADGNMNAPTEQDLRDLQQARQAWEREQDKRVLSAAKRAPRFADLPTGEPPYLDDQGGQWEFGIAGADMRLLAGWRWSTREFECFVEPEELVWAMRRAFAKLGRGVQ